MHLDTWTIVCVLGAVLFAALGGWCLWAARQDSAPHPALSGIGPVSDATLLAAGLSGWWVAYHLIVYSLEIERLHPLRAPVWAVISVVILAIGLSLISDRIENSREARDSDHSR